MYLYQSGLGRFNSSHTQGSCFEVCHGHIEFERTVPVPRGVLLLGSVSSKLMYIVYDELSVHGAECYGQTCLSLQPAVHPDLVLFFIEYMEFGVFLLLTLPYVGLAVAVVS